MTAEAQSGHIPVLMEAVVRHLTAAGHGLYVDATFGGGGHTRALLLADPRNRVIALDCDPEAVERGQAMVAAFGGRLQLCHANFTQLAEYVAGDCVGILFDFGVSSYHLDEGRRGFSFREDAPLDMRLNTQAGITAREFLQGASREELVRAVRQFGEEPRWRVVVDAIEGARGSTALNGTLAFAALVETALGGRRHYERIHPATRTFQGIRIAVNRELEVIETALPIAFRLLSPGGRLAAISFHSLEDRIVKRLFRRLAGKAEHSRDGRPEDLRERHATLLTRKPIVADAAELERNPRARSAKLRLIEKLATAA